MVGVVLSRSCSTLPFTSAVVTFTVVLNLADIQ